MPLPEILILGGGIIGLASARELSRRGRAVEVVERGRVGREASWAAAGLLAPLAESMEGGPLLAAGRAARDLWPAWAAELAGDTGVELGYDRSGALVLDTGDGRAERFAHKAAQHGEPCETLERSTLEDLTGELAAGVTGGLRLGGEHRVDNRRVVEALARDLARRGVRVHEGHEVRRVELAGPSGGVELRGEGFSHRAAHLVVTAGAWSGAVDGLPPLPVRPVRGQMLELGGVDWRWQGSVWGGGLYAVGRRGGRLLIGATVEEAGFAAHPTADGLAWIVARLHPLYPGLGERPVMSFWAGLRPATADGLPFLGRLGDLPVTVAAGHYRSGILLAPWTALHLPAWLEGGEAPDPAFAAVRGLDS